MLLILIIMVGIGLLLLAIGTAVYNLAGGVTKLVNAEHSLGTTVSY